MGLTVIITVTVMLPLVLLMMQTVYAVYDLLQYDKAQPAVAKLPAFFG